MKISIEYAHIYTNQHISEEHQKSSEILSEIKKEQSEHDLSLVIMVDDYSFPDPSFDYDEFSSWLSDRGHAPDLIIKESSLIAACDEVVKKIQNPELKNDLENYIRTKKYPCSLFIASWYLVRLGKVSVAFFSAELAADKLINILPESFKPFEDRAIEIIEATNFAESTNAIENRYFEGRIVE